ncbi:MAG: (2Fe-2S) ferredoxin domain-containing protein [Bacteroidia bacterium]|nr:(2Fe-2S) ferredoxin domain-containing protein [Bacteroidia bacterium]
MKIYDIHIFVCTNERKNSNRLSCGEQHGLLLIEKFKQVFAALKIEGNIRIQRCGCLGICDLGPTIAIYPEGVFYVNVQPTDVEELVHTHFIQKRKLERLLLSKHPKQI